ncbi:hypothetical protein D3C84_685940 [compost metagenome]
MFCLLVTQRAERLLVIIGQPINSDLGAFHQSQRLTWLDENLIRRHLEQGDSSERLVLREQLLKLPNGFFPDFLVFGDFQLNPTKLIGCFG